MSLDPQIAPFVAAGNRSAANQVSIAEQTIEQRRAAYLALAKLAGPGPDLARVDDLDIAGVPCRIYASDAPIGLILYFHGGGFTIGDLETHDEPCRQLALETNTTLISVDYRLAPEHPFPAAVDDAWLVFKHVDAHRDELAGGGKLIVVGDSAGGSLAAVLAIMARDHEIDLAAQILIYPSVDFDDTSPSMTENGEGYGLTQDVLDWHRGHYQPDPTDWRASPLVAESHEGLAPALIVTAEFDMLRDQGFAYAEKLRASGVEVRHKNYEGMVHAFFHMGPLVDAARQCVTEIATTARAVLAE